MSEADLKLKLIRLIDSQNGDVLQELYNLIISTLYREKRAEEQLSAVELGYQQMAQDTEREEEAFEWIEGTLDLEEL